MPHPISEAWGGGLKDGRSRALLLSTSPTELSERDDLSLSDRKRRRKEVGAVIGVTTAPHSTLAMRRAARIAALDRRPSVPHPVLRNGMGHPSNRVPHPMSEAWGGGLTDGRSRALLLSTSPTELSERDDLSLSDRKRRRKEVGAVIGVTTAPHSTLAMRRAARIAALDRRPSVPHPVLRNGMGDPSNRVPHPMSEAWGGGLTDGRSRALLLSTSPTELSERDDLSLSDRKRRRKEVGAVIGVTTAPTQHACHAPRGSDCGVGSEAFSPPPRPSERDGAPERLGTGATNRV